MKSKKITIGQRIKESRKEKNPMQDMKSIKVIVDQRIKELRKEKNLTQNRLSELLNIRQSNVSDWENGVSRPEYEHLILLSKIFAVTTDYLIGTENEDGSNDSL
jgi:transcriptional regulator with XRE-family HTH domain